MTRRFSSNDLTTIATLALAGLASAALAQDGVIYIDASRPAGGDGTTWSQAFRDPQVAFDSLFAIPGENLRGVKIEFHIAQGVYRPAQMRDFAFSIRADISEAASLTIAGGYAGASSPTPDARDFVGTPTVLSGDVLGDDLPEFVNREDNCLAVLAPFDAALADTQRVCNDVTVSGLTLSGGMSNLQRLRSGTGFQGKANPIDPANPGQSYSFIDCTIRDNSSGGEGGGIGFLAFQTGLTGTVHVDILRCTITGNRAAWDGGGIALLDNYSAVIERSSITDNIAVQGGGLACGGDTTVDRCLIAGNRASRLGGGVCGSSSDARFWVISSLLAGNSAELGGGLYLPSGSLENCTIAGNHANYGGGVFAVTNNCNFWYSVIAKNMATTNGSQLAGGSFAPFTYKTAIETQESGCYFPFGLGWLPPLLPFDVEFVNPAGPDGDPNTWADNDYHPNPRSQLVDACDTWPGLELDLDGNPRRVEGIQGRGLAMDLGCYETQATLCVADLSADGGVNVDDLIEYLAEFEAGRSTADLVGDYWFHPVPDGAVNIGDLVYFLMKFEDGC